MDIKLLAQQYYWRAQNLTVLLSEFLKSLAWDQKKIQNDFGSSTEDIGTEKQCQCIFTKSDNFQQKWLEKQYYQQVLKVEKYAFQFLAADFFASQNVSDYNVKSSQEVFCLHILYIQCPKSGFLKDCLVFGHCTIHGLVLKNLSFNYQTMKIGYA